MVIQSDYINEPFTDSLYASKAFDFYFQDFRTGILDIETTGLSPDSSAFILGGLISYEEQSLEQFFVEDLAHEKEVLELFLNRLRDFDVIITYNGQSFDIPFLLKRAGKLGIPVNFTLPYNLDLYLVLNNHSTLRKILPNLKQKTVETFMGLWASREDEISGKESVYLYFEYLNTRNREIKEKILLHNRDDVQQLSKLLPILEKLDFHKAMHHMGFPARTHLAPGDWITLQKINLDSRQLNASGRQGNFPRNYASFGNGKAEYLVDFREKNHLFQITIPTQHHEDLVFLDLANILPGCSELKKYPFYENDFLIIKSLATINHLEVNHFLKLFMNSIGE